MANYFIILLAPLFISGCIEGPGLFDQAGAENAASVVAGKEDAPGVITGLFKAGASTIQTLNATGAIAGTSLSFPPGAISVNTNVTIEEGGAIANSAVANKLGLGSSGFSAASNAVVVNSSVAMDTDKPFTLQIPVAGSGLVGFGLAAKKLIVVYKVTKVGQGNKKVAGVIPPDKVILLDGKASFETTFFGSFQLAYTEADITAPLEAEDNSPILSKRDEAALPTINWEGFFVQVNPGNRSVDFDSGVSGMGAVDFCMLEIDDNKEPPFLEAIQLADADYRTVFATTDQAQTLYARYVCEGADGRIDESPWSGAGSISKLEAFMIDHNETVQVVGDGVVEYQVGFSVASDCSGASYGGFLPVSHQFNEDDVPTAITDGYLCVKAKDVAGNVQSVATALLNEGGGGGAAEIVTFTGQLARSSIIDVYVSNTDTTDRFLSGIDAQKFADLTGTCTGAGDVYIYGDIRNFTGGDSISVPCDATGNFTVELEWNTGSSASASTKIKIATDMIGDGRYKINAHQNGPVDTTYVYYYADPTSPAISTHKVADQTQLKTALDTAAANTDHLIWLTGDINMTSDWVQSNNLLNSKIYGDGYAINDMTIPSTPGPLSGHAGLIGIIGTGGIYDLTFDGFSVSGATGGATGVAAGSTWNAGSEIVNITLISGTVTAGPGNAGYGVGGVVGSAGNVKMHDIYVSALVTVDGGTTGDYVGGIAGILSGGSNLEYSRSSATVTASKAAAVAGGVMGKYNPDGSASSTMYGLLSEGVTVTSSNGHAGGIIGEAANVSMGTYTTFHQFKCDLCTITSGSAKSAGGLFGEFNIASEALEIHDSYVIDSAITTSGSMSYAAGLVGFTASTGGITFNRTFVLDNILDEDLGTQGAIFGGSATADYSTSLVSGSYSNDNGVTPVAASSLYDLTTYTTAGWVDGTDISNTSNGSLPWYLDPDGSKLPHFNWDWPND